MPPSALAFCRLHVSNFSKLASQGIWHGRKTSADSVKKKTNYQGIPVRIDRPKGFIQEGKDFTGKPWRRVYQVDYGFIPRTEGGDGDELDVFLGPDAEAPTAWWVNLNKPDGTFDEYKVFLGFRTRASALSCYNAHIPQALRGGVAGISIGMMKTLLGLPQEKKA